MEKRKRNDSEGESNKRSEVTWNSTPRALVDYDSSSDEPNSPPPLYQEEPSSPPAQHSILRRLLTTANPISWTDYNTSRAIFTPQPSTSRASSPPPQHGTGQNTPCVTYLELRKRFCRQCFIQFQSMAELQQHLLDQHREAYCRNTSQHYQFGGQQQPINIELTQTYFDDTISTYEANFNDNVVNDVETLFLMTRGAIEDIMQTFLIQQLFYRIQFAMELHFTRTSADGTVQHAFPHFAGFLLNVNHVQDIDFVIETSRNVFTERVERYERNGSGWKLEEIKGFIINIMDYEPLPVGRATFQLPTALKRKSHTLINPPLSTTQRGEIINDCFHKCIIAALIYDDVAPRRRKRDLEQGTRIYEENVHAANFANVSVPFTLNEVVKFCKDNSDIGLSIMEYDRERRDEYFDSEDDDDSRTSDFTRYQQKRDLCRTIREKCVPIHMHVGPEKPHMIDLLMIANQEKTDYHFCLITNLYGFLSKPGSRVVRHICRGCFFSFGDSYEEHIKTCHERAPLRIDFPDEKYIKFSNYYRMLQMPFVFYADLESVLYPVNLHSGNTRKVQEHVPSTYAWLCVDYHGNIIQKMVYTAKDEHENIVKKMLKEILNVSVRLVGVMKNWEHTACSRMDNIPTHIVQVLANKDLLVNYKCGFCGIRFNPDSNVVRHHSHLPDANGNFNFEFLACQGCNMHARQEQKINVFLHNNKSYDSHWILTSATRDVVEDVDLICQSSEKIIAMFLGKHVQILDSFSHLSHSLEALGNTLNKETDFNITRRAFDRMGSSVDMLLGKAIFPYNYCTSLERMKNCTALPDREEFYNDLKEEPVDEEAYQNALRVWQTLGIKNLIEYAELYCLIDICTLADAFSKYRKTIYSNFKIDPAWSFSLPMVAYDVCLKYTGARIELIKDMNMLSFVESALRGGFCSGGDLKFAKANNKMVPGYDASKPTSWITLIDANSLYASTMTMNLCEGEYKWTDGDLLKELQERKEAKILELDPEGETGYLISVDAYFPDETHDDLNAYPCAPVTRKVGYDELSNFQKEFARALNISPQSLKSERLVADLNPRKNYVVHYMTLQIYIKRGMRISRVNRVLQYKQSPYLAPYIRHVNALRQQARHKADSEVLKALGNCTFGKMIENMRNRVGIKVIRETNKLQYYLRKPTTQRVIPIRVRNQTHDMALIVQRKTSVMMNKAIINGCIILDLSKFIMNKFYHEFFHKLYRGNHSLLMTDTDSFAVLTTCENIYDDMKRLHDNHFDATDYPQDHPFFGKYFNPAHKKKLFYFKNEHPSSFITDIIFCKPKLYVVRSIKHNESEFHEGCEHEWSDQKKGKGINKSALKNQCAFDDYMRAIKNPIQTYCKMRQIRSYKHAVYTIESEKRCINSLDVKRKVMEGNLLSYAHGHYRTRDAEMHVQSPCSDDTDQEN